MIGVLAQRLASVPLVLITVTVLVFATTQFIPGSAASTLAADGANAESIARVEQQLGLDKNPVVQYVEWTGRLARGNLGRSLIAPVSVTEELASRIPVTVELTLLAILFSVVLGIPLGIVAARRPGGLVDGVVRLISIFSLGLPDFVVGIVLIYFASLRFGWFPPSGFVPLSEGVTQNLRSMVLPVVALGLAEVGLVARQMRAALLSELARGYVVAARAKGLSSLRVWLNHALRNAWLPIVTVVGVRVGRWLGGAVIVEVLFGLPGVGRMAVDAVKRQDIPMVQGSVLVLIAGVLLANLIVDLLYGVIDPRIRQV